MFAKTRSQGTAHEQERSVSPAVVLPSRDSQDAEEEGLLVKAEHLSSGLSGRMPNLSPFHAGVCCLLSVQNSSYVLLRRYSSGVLHEEASAQSILAVGEVLKLCFSWLMILRESPDDPGEARLHDSAKRGPRWFAETSLKLVRTSAKMATKILFTAVLSRLLLQRLLSLARWRAILTLFLSVLIICHQTQPQAACAPPPRETLATAEHMQQAADMREAMAGEGGGPTERAWHDYVVGVSAVTLEAMLSGLSNVYFERVLKSTALSLWERNVQLAGYSLLIYVPMAQHAHPGDGMPRGCRDMLHGWSGVTVVVACLGALGGILIGLVLKYCDSIIKNLALSTAIITTATLDHFVFHGPMNLPIIAAAGSVLISIINYTDA
ncbi:hypothetical protein EMIHUDRAFT_107320 [Emiliania huxleyi CCMP1516]|uniref:Uncharacterized protein n=2 Tax=Emiliania huxleyi TaxID=2903 RepID=A0A0D3I336_EMIH1|nr:hypothetical protein EMIHUDRAFT_107320 [Emiliania huxleyi CCMP1516]EOD05671.1 hypothetical protein EMIHUDRAFT_107320 [Emiliania huxleyi CCMP1516]|eukprot:XP_005758100.1 hypothetical protein EMIHUDRAFT_107320 [Emiliania huxleyi CCMP1516]